MDTDMAVVTAAMAADTVLPMAADTVLHMAAADILTEVDTTEAIILTRLLLQSSGVLQIDRLNDFGRFNNSDSLFRCK